MRESARIYDVRMAQFVLKIEKLSHITGVRESRDLRSPSPIMARAMFTNVIIIRILKTLKSSDMGHITISGFF